MKVDIHVFLPTAIKGTENRFRGFSVRFPDINWTEACPVPEMDEYKYVYSLLGFTSGAVCVLGNNSVYPEDIDTTFILSVGVNPDTKNIIN